MNRGRSFHQVPGLRRVVHARSSPNTGAHSRRGDLDRRRPGAAAARGSGKNGACPIERPSLGEISDGPLCDAPPGWVAAVMQGGLTSANY
jgi:hypothetical protein